MGEIAQKYEVLNMEDYAMPIASLVKQVALIQAIMASVMKKDEHYGVIPGTNKPTLLKPGAEKLCLTFRLNPDYEVIKEFREKDFIAYTVKCALTHIPTSQKIASGIGSCNSKEAKYRFRYDYELTDTVVPKDYWKAKSAGNSQEMKRILGEGFITKKNESTGQWVLARSQKVENENPWDLDNTLIKMACKRALVAAVLNATAASDIFTQDVEDLPPEYLGNPKTAHEAVPESIISETGDTPPITSVERTDYTKLKAKEGYDRGMAVKPKDPGATFKCGGKTVNKTKCNDGCPFIAECPAWSA